MRCTSRHSRQARLCRICSWRESACICAWSGLQSMLRCCLAEVATVAAASALTAATVAAAEADPACLKLLLKLLLLLLHSYICRCRWSKHLLMCTQCSVYRHPQTSPGCLCAHAYQALMPLAIVGVSAVQNCSFFLLYEYACILSLLSFMPTPLLPPLAASCWARVFCDLTTFNFWAYSRCR